MNAYKTTSLMDAVTSDRVPYHSTFLLEAAGMLTRAYGSAIPIVVTAYARMARAIMRFSVIIFLILPVIIRGFLCANAAEPLVEFSVELPGGNQAGIERLRVVVTDQWRLNQYSVVRQEYVLDDRELVLISGAIVIAPFGSASQAWLSLLWPYPSSVNSPNSYVDRKLPVKAVSADDFDVPMHMLVQYRRNRRDRWQPVFEDMPFISSIVFDAVRGQVDEFASWSKIRRDAEREGRLPELAASVRAQGSREMGFALKLSEQLALSERKSGVLKGLLTEMGGYHGQRFDNDALYILGEIERPAGAQRGVGEKPVCIPAYIESDSTDDWNPELRLVPIPASWSEIPLQHTENTAAIMTPAQVVDFLPVDIRPTTLEPVDLSVGSLNLQEVLALSLPAQTLCPPWLPKPLLSRLANNQVGLLRWSELSGYRWDVVRQIPASEIERHKQIEISVVSRQRKHEERRFVILSHQQGRWQPVSHDVDGFTQFSIETGKTERRFIGRRDYSWYPSKRSVGRIAAGADLLVVVLPPQAVYGKRLERFRPSLLIGDIESNQKWLKIVTD